MLEQLQLGEDMHRAAWPIKEGYLRLMKGMNHVWKIVVDPAPNAGNFIFSMEDFLGEDWQKFELPEVTPVVIDASTVVE